MWMVSVELGFEMKYNKNNTEILADIWDNSRRNSIICPKCNRNLVLIQLDPLPNNENAYITYDTIIECTFCSFKIRAESFIILGCVKNFDLNNVEICGWSPTGSRFFSNYEHVLDYDLLKKLKESAELVEFLIVNRYLVKIIG